MTQCSGNYYACAWRRGHSSPRIILFHRELFVSMLSDSHSNYTPDRYCAPISTGRLLCKTFILFILHFKLNKMLIAKDLTEGF